MSLYFRPEKAVLGDTEGAKELVYRVKTRYLTDKSALEQPGPGFTSFDMDWMLSEWGQGEAIARNLLEMSDLKVPVLSVVIGEGGSVGTKNICFFVLRA